MNSKSCHKFFLLAAFIVAATAMLLAQEAYVYVEASPPEAQVFVDGKNWGNAGRQLKVTPGTHTISVFNYGFSPQIREAQLSEGVTRMEFHLEPMGDRVTGPAWGRIQIEDAPGDAAVFMNGTTGGYFVGHADMFNNNAIWRQQLVVPAGKHHVTIMRRGAEVVWSGDVEVPANKRVIVHTATGNLTTKDWPQGKNLTSLRRFKAGLATASVAVEQVTATFAAEPTHINCGDTTKLAWTTKEAVESSITANSTSLGDLTVNGEKTDQPKQTTAYNFNTSGPGGVVTSDATVEVNTAVQANMTANPTEVRYHRMGDKVLEQTPINLTWSSSNSHAASLEPIGTVNTSGDQSVKPEPKQANNGPVDEKVTYTFIATNICGGSGTQTANVHITGTIEPVPEVPLVSVFFPTGYPGKRHPSLGLVRSQQNTLAKTAEVFKKYLIYDPEARLTLTAHADKRGRVEANQALSERRANRVKASLASQGIAEDKVDVVAVGEKQNLDRTAIIKLHAENPHKSKLTKLPSEALVWAYNRRVDVTLLPTGQKSTQFFPADAEDAKLMFSSQWQNRRAIERADELTAQPSTGATTGTQQPTAEASVASPSSN